MAINKVNFGNTTLIDITDTTATASDVSTGKYFYAANGEKVQGTAVVGGMTVVETTDIYGGTIVEISGDPVVLQPKSVTPSTSSQTVAPDSGYTGLSEVIVAAIPSQYVIPAGTTTITANGSGINVAAYASANVSVTPNLQSKINISPTTSSQTISADNGYDGLSSVQINAMPAGTAGTPTATKGTVNNHQVSVTPSVTNVTGYITGGTKTGTAVTVSASELVSGSETKSANGTYDVTNLSQIIVSVPAQGTDTTDATLSSGAQMLAGVTAYAKAVKYTGTIPTKSATDLTESGSTIFVPSGYYSVQAMKSVTATAFPTSVALVSVYPEILTIGRSTSDQYINIQSGYKTSSVCYKISSVPNGTVTAPATITGTSATVTTGTNTVTFSKAISVTPNVTMAGYISQGTAGNATVTLTANISTTAATTYNTSTADQTITASRYLTGAQTIKSVITTNLSASNILSGVTIKVGDANDDDRIASVTGTVAFQTIYSGSGNPSSGTGVNGDIYIKTA